MYSPLNWLLVWLSASVLSKQTSSLLITNAIAFSCNISNNSSFNSLNLTVGVDGSVGDLEKKIESEMKNGSINEYNLTLLKFVTKKENKILFETLISIEAVVVNISYFIPEKSTEEFDYEIIGNLTTVLQHRPWYTPLFAIFVIVHPRPRGRFDQEFRCDVKFETSDSGSLSEPIQQEVTNPPSKLHQLNNTDSPSDPLQLEITDSSSESPQQPKDAHSPPKSLQKGDSSSPSGLLPRENMNSSESPQRKDTNSSPELPQQEDTRPPSKSPQQDDTDSSSKSPQQEVMDSSSKSSQQEVTDTSSKSPQRDTTLRVSGNFRSKFWMGTREICLMLLLIPCIWVYFRPSAEDASSSQDARLRIAPPPDTTNSQIETRLGIIISNISSIVSKLNVEASKAVTFIRSVEASQGGSSISLPATRIVATQALRAFIARILSDSVLPQGNPFRHPLFPSSEEQKRLYEEWLKTRRDFVNFGQTNDQRQVIPQHVNDNITTNSALAKKKKELVLSTTQEIENEIKNLCHGWNQSVRKDIEELAESALELAFDMMSRDLPIFPHWIKPGEKFMEDYMKMSDISVFDGTVGLCVFPRWVDSEDFTIVKARVYCV